MIAVVTFTVCIEKTLGSTMHGSTAVFISNSELVGPRDQSVGPYGYDLGMAMGRKDSKVRAL